MTAIQIVKTRWVCCNKGDEEHPEVSCRLVAQEFASKDGDREDLFAGTPPLMATRLILSDVASGGSDGVGEKSLMVPAHRLRAAFEWLLQNCWPWLQATKYQEAASPGDLGSQLET